MAVVDDAQLSVRVGESSDWMISDPVVARPILRGKVNPDRDVRRSQSQTTAIP